jgi:CDP-6-deoxy-D-xylo-4-hexulose-3-dehydrase
MVSLAANPFGEEEILAMTDVLLSGRLTLGVNVEEAEKAFAKKIGTPYAVMVNSGSSANLLMIGALCCIA